MGTELILKKAIEKLLDYKSSATNFTAQLYQLMAKADGENKARLQKAFPIEGQAYDLWSHAPDEKKFFAEWGIELPEHLDDSGIFSARGPEFDSDLDARDIERVRHSTSADLDMLDHVGRKEKKKGA